MDSTSFFNLYMMPPNDAAQLESKASKAPVSDKDVERFETILAGEGAYMPKSLDTVIPATDPNAVQRIGSNVLNRITDLKQSVNDRHNRISEIFDDSDFLSMKDALKAQWEVTMYSVESTLIATTAGKAGEGVKTLFRNQ